MSNTGIAGTTGPQEKELNERIRKRMLRCGNLLYRKNKKKILHP